jgi:hypothetical protein
MEWVIEFFKMLMISGIHSRTRQSGSRIVAILTMMSLLVVYSSTGTLAYGFRRARNLIVQAGSVHHIGVMSIYAPMVNPPFIPKWPS